jgi:hypothetical protein
MSTQTKMIKHFPITNINRIIEHYSKKDGVPVTYVCTTDIKTSDMPIDIFYRDTPHPKFGNRYFGVYWHKNLGYMICNADDVEHLTFGLVEDDDEGLQYSQHHHDYKSFDNGSMIDGGREYIRSSGKMYLYKVKDGKMVGKNKNGPRTTKQTI